MAPSQSTLTRYVAAAFVTVSQLLSLMNSSLPAPNGCPEYCDQRTLLPCSSCPVSVGEAMPSFHFDFDFDRTARVGCVPDEPPHHFLANLPHLSARELKESRSDTERGGSALRFTNLSAFSY